MTPISGYFGFLWPMHAGEHVSFWLKVLLAGCGMVHFIAYAVLLGAAISRLLTPASLDVAARRDVHRVFYRIGSVCLMALIVTGVANIYPLIELDHPIRRNYLIALAAKLTMAGISTVVFILELVLSRSNPDERALAPVRVLLAVFLLLTGLAGYFVVHQEP